MGLSVLRLVSVSAVFSGCESYRNLEVHSKSYNQIPPALHAASLDSHEHRGHKINVYRLEGLCFARLVSVLFIT
jgi:hypothetical protein